MYVDDEDRLAIAARLEEGIQIGQVEPGIAVGKAEIGSGIMWCLTRMHSPIHGAFGARTTCLEFNRGVVPCRTACCAMPPTGPGVTRLRGKTRIPSRPLRGKQRSRRAARSDRL